MAEEKQKKDSKNEENLTRTPDSPKTEISETWAEETIADLDDFIESQGIYIRQ